MTASPLPTRTTIATTINKGVLAAIGGLLLGAGLSGAIGIAPGVLHVHRIGPYYETAKINDKVRDGMTDTLHAH